jgi:hypothetical protein
MTVPARTAGVSSANGTGSTGDGVAKCAWEGMEALELLRSNHESTIVPRSLGKEDSKHEVSWKPFVGTLRVESPSGRA